MKATSLHVLMVRVFLTATNVMEKTTAVTDRTNVNVVINFVLLYLCIDVDQRFSILQFPICCASCLDYGPLWIKISSDWDKWFPSYCSRKLGRKYRQFLFTLSDMKTKNVQHVPQRLTDTVTDTAASQLLSKTVDIFYFKFR